MRTVLVSFAAGLLFAVGLGIAGMTQADKVIGFLEVTGDWDPSLAFVMVGAIATHAVLRWFVMRRASPVFERRFYLPKRVEIDPTLLGGAALFGVGWAIGGYCPGPGIVSAASFTPEPWVFLGTMTLAMLGWQWVQRRSVGRRPRVHPQPLDVASLKSR